MNRLEPSSPLCVSLLIASLLIVPSTGCVDEFDDFDEFDEEWRNSEDSLGPIDDELIYDGKCPVLDEPTSEGSDPASSSADTVQKLGHPTTSTPTIPPVIDGYDSGPVDPDCLVDAPSTTEDPTAGEEPILEAPGDDSCDPANDPDCA